MNFAETIMDRCEIVAGISETHEGINRFYLTTQHKVCNRQIAQWMGEAGMEVWQDAVGNQWGRYRSDEPDAKRLVLGSHLDSVRNAGRYDGVLGTISAISVVQYFHDKGRKLPFHLDVVAFGDQEGIRFDTHLLTSHMVAGNFKPEMLKREDAQGVSLEKAFQKFGLDAGLINDAVVSGDDLVGYLELHVEQGPILDNRDVPVGVLTAIAGVKQFEVTIHGSSGHAGNFPMAMRKDALVAAAEMITVVASVAKRQGAVASVGELDVSPGELNVIPDTVRFTVDIRSDNRTRRDRTTSEILSHISTICQSGDLAFETKVLRDVEPVESADWWQELLSTVISSKGQDVVEIFSGAGHDARAMSYLTDMGMLLIRCKDGVSHCPHESVEIDDVDFALRCTISSVKRIADRVTAENREKLATV